MFALKIKSVQKLIIITLFFLVSCSTEEQFIVEDNENINSISGTGVIQFTSINKSISIYYHIPNFARKTTKMVFVFHGNGRNAKDYRDATISKANEFGFIVIAPEFSSANFPSGDQYNLGNVFVDGDNPSPNTLNPEEEWTFSLIEPIFDFLKKEIGNTSTSYHIIGHSAGSQFAHRFLLFKPNNNVDKTVLSAAGWYTIPNTTFDFPYGINKTPLEYKSLSYFFQKKIIVQVGELDNDPNASGLRKNSIVNQQGLNRFTRANYFFKKAKETSQQNNIPLSWQFFVNQGLDHDFKPAISKAVDYLFKQ